MEIVSTIRVFDGDLIKYRFFSKSLQCDTQFNVFLPKESTSTLLFLSGLTCTENNFMEKSGAIEVASRLKMAIVAPDTSPRSVKCKDDTLNWDFGEGAGYYVDATTLDYKMHYNMYSFVFELIDLFDSLSLKKPIHLSGHSVGGMGALQIGLKNPDMFTSVSAFAPVSNPMNSPWGQKAFTLFLGNNQDNWEQYDPCHLLKNYKHSKRLNILVDQGSKDQFLGIQFHSDSLVNSAEHSNVDLTYNLKQDYDHSYYFISTFIEDHLVFHSKFK